MAETRQSTPTWHDGIALVRVAFGALLLYRGWELFIGREEVMSSWQSLPAEIAEVLSFAAPALAALAGAFVVVGLFTRLTTFMVAVSCGLALYLNGQGEVLSTDHVLFLWGMIALTFFFSGGGRLSLDHFLHLNRRAQSEREELNRFGRYVSR